MRKALEFIRAAIVVSAVPIVLMFYASTSRTMYIALFVYIVLATILLLVLNQVLKADDRDDSSAPPAEPPK